MEGSSFVAVGSGDGGLTSEGRASAGGVHKTSLDVIHDVGVLVT